MNIDTKNKILEVIADKGKYTGISAKRIIDEIKISRTTLTEYLTEMQNVGLIAFKYRKGPSKLYHIKEKEI